MTNAHLRKTWNIFTGWKAFRTIKNWNVILMDYCGLVSGSNITYVFRNGVKCKTRANNKDDRAVIKGVWLREVYLLKKDDIHEGSIVIDLGAQIGVFSLFAATYARNVKVYSYEPFPENFNLLIENIKINELEKHIIPSKVAVSDSRKNIKFFVDEKSTTSHSAIIPHDKHIIVNATTLIDIFEDNKLPECDLLKIDIEGSEYPVLYSIPKYVLKKIRRIYIEYEEIDSFPDFNHQFLKKYLEKNGFKVTHRKPFLYAIRNG